jgi:hypothetical protein
MVRITNAKIPAGSTTPPYRRDGWSDAARGCVGGLLRLEIGVYEDELVRWRGPD